MKKKIFILIILANLANASLEIKRDKFDMPHVYADNVYELFFGYGYSIAKDRLFQLEMSKRTTQGRVSEVLGESFLEFDTKIRQEYYFKPVKEQFDRLPKEDKDILQGYADGINLYIQEVNKDEENLLSKQFYDYDFKPSLWNAFDVAMVFIGSMINRFGDYNTELENAMIFQNLKNIDAKNAQDIFDYLLPYVSKNAVDTIDKDEWTNEIREKYKKKVLSNLETNNNLDISYEKIKVAIAKKDRAFSNMVILGKKRLKNASSILINGPQFGFFQPAYTYSIGLHGAGYDTVGNSPFGYPLVEFGHNENIAWGSTWGAADNVDIFVLKLDKTGTKYMQNGKFVNLDIRDEIIKVKAKEDKIIKSYRSKYGSIVGFDENKTIAYAKKRAWEGKEIETLIAWNKLTKAKNHQEWKEQVAKSAINVNLYYSDKDGNIAYALGGLYPIRNPKVDGRLPTLGNGEFDWLGYYPFETNPQVYNPKSGYIANWNNRIGFGFPNPDESWYSWESADRVLVLKDLIEKKEQFSEDEAWQIMTKAAQIDPNAKFFIPNIIKEADKYPQYKQIVKILQSWRDENYINKDDDNDLMYDNPAVAIFRYWLKFALKNAYNSNETAKSISKFFISNGYPAAKSSIASGYNIQVGAKVLHKWLSEKSPENILFGNQNKQDFYMQSLKDAIDELEKDFSKEPTKWLLRTDTMKFSHLNFQKIPQASKDEDYSLPLAMNRGTENNIVIFSNSQVKSKEVVPLGQSGFISKDGIKSVHYDNQKNLYNNYQLKDIYFYKDDVEKNAIYKKTLNIKKD